FLMNLVTHPDFLAGRVTTRFLDDTPELFDLPQRQDRATKLLTYIGEVIVNGHPELRDKVARWQGDKVKERQAPAAPDPGRPPISAAFLSQRRAPVPPGTRDKFMELGPERFAQWVRGQRRLFVTDTTFRDAHQSLLATRMRTHDMLQVAPAYAARHAG